jgi:dihydropyrimidinase
MGLVLSGGTVVGERDCRTADVRLADGRIAAVGPAVAGPGDEVWPVAGCFLLPGGVDPHTHFDLPVAGTRTSDDFLSGTRAALLGGTTTIIDFATQFRGESLAAALAARRALAAACYTDYGFHMAVTDWTDSTAAEMDTLVREEGISSFKLYLAYKNSLQVDDLTLLGAMRQAGESHALVCLHCENGDMVEFLAREACSHGETGVRLHPLTRPPAAEEEAVFRAVRLAGAAGAPLYVVHLSCRAALAVVGAAREGGAQVYAETCPQYLLLDESLYRGDEGTAAGYVCAPPLRTPADQAALWEGLRTGLLDTVGTDHCSFNQRGRNDLGRGDFRRIPGGLPGVETRLALLYTYGVTAGRISINRFVELVATGPARLFGLYPRKGTVAVGGDADLVVWDPAAAGVIRAADLSQAVDYTPFEGFARAGAVRHVFLRGRPVVVDGRLADEQPRGVYLYRQPWGGGR